MDLITVHLDVFCLHDVHCTAQAGHARLVLNKTVTFLRTTLYTSFLIKESLYIQLLLFFQPITNSEVTRISYICWKEVPGFNLLSEQKFNFKVIYARNKMKLLPEDRSKTPKRSQGAKNAQEIDCWRIGCSNLHTLNTYI